MVKKIKRKVPEKIQEDCKKKHREFYDPIILSSDNGLDLKKDRNNKMSAGPGGVYYMTVN